MCMLYEVYILSADSNLILPPVFQLSVCNSNTCQKTTSMTGTGVQKRWRTGKAHTFGYVNLHASVSEGHRRQTACNWVQSLLKIFANNNMGSSKCIQWLQLSELSLLNYMYERRSWIGPSHSVSHTIKFTSPFCLNGLSWTHLVLRSRKLFVETTQLLKSYPEQVSKKAKLCQKSGLATEYYLG
jgi:hypothetical protein